MSFIKISNPVEGGVNRLYLEKLGLSTKRQDEATIGQFGSGVKFAPISALRKDIRWISVGEDELGPYQLEFVCKEEGGINNIYCLYDGKDLKATSFTLEAGMLSWEDDFQIFREAFANALDEKTLNGVDFKVEIVDQVKNESGVFAVYLTATPELVDIVNNFDAYFSINRDPVVDGYYKIYDPLGKYVNIYCKGVRVFEGEDFYPPVFDYEFNIELNEERRIRSEWSMFSGVAHALSALRTDTEGHVDLAKRFINQVQNSKKFETVSLSPDHFSKWNITANSAFNRAFTEIYGEDVCIVSMDDASNASKVKMYDLKPKIIKDEVLYTILKYAGIKCYEDVVIDVPVFKFFKLNKMQQEMFDTCDELIRKYFPMVWSSAAGWKFFIPIGDQDDILGIANRPEDVIYLSVRNFSDIETLLGTMVHELHHIFYNHADHDADFRSFADVAIGRLLMKLKGSE